MAIQSTRVYSFDDKSPISGSVEVNIPTCSERLRLISKLKLKVDKQSNTILNDTTDGLEIVADSIELLEPFIAKIDCEIKDSKEKIQTFHELCLFDECQVILIKASTEMVKGITLGKH